MKIKAIFYSTYGHMLQMAKAAAEGVKEAGVEVELLPIPETLPNEVLEQMGALEAQKQFADIPLATVESLAEADGFIFGVPTKYGTMAYQVKQFLDQTSAVGNPGTREQACRGHVEHGDSARGTGDGTHLNVCFAHAPRHDTRGTAVFLPGADGR